jgi:molybdopterin synthase catalytic subunit
VVELANAIITRDVIDTNALLATAAGRANGAITLFVGIVRDHNDARPVRGMRYDAYEEMATTVLAEIVAEAKQAMGDGTLIAVHRIGELAVGDVSVAIAAGAPHRAPTFDAARYVIEEIKRRLPVWKEEHYTDGDAQWLAGQIPPVPELHS